MSYNPSSTSSATDEKGLFFGVGQGKKGKKEKEKKRKKGRKRIKKIPTFGILTLGVQHIEWLPEAKIKTLFIERKNGFFSVLGKAKKGKKRKKKKEKKEGKEEKKEEKKERKKQRIQVFCVC